MTLGIIGQKCGMTRIFTENGESIPVTVIEVKPNRITQVKSLATDGYRAIQVTTGHKPASRLTKPLIGHYAKAKIEGGLGLWEFRLDDEGKNETEVQALEVGAEIQVGIFKAGDVVDIQGVTKGKGFAGVIKRYHFNSQDASHGNSLSHRAPGSIGQRQTPGRVFKGKKMAGHLGDVKRTVKNQEVVRVDVERNLLLVRGGVPGAPNSVVVIKPAMKQKKFKNNEKKGK